MRRHVGRQSQLCSSRVFVAAAERSTGAVQVGGPDLSARTAVWSPDGTTIAFSSGDAQSGDAQKGIGLYLMKADGTDVRRLGEVSGTWWSFMHPAWSPDGDSIAAAGGMETFDMWLFASDGSAEKMVFTQEAPTDQGIPAYAPDGVLAGGVERRSSPEPCFSPRADTQDAGRIRPSDLVARRPADRNHDRKRAR
jgi:hypothetical protein